MSFLPIVERELRLAARRPATYWTRFWAAFVFVVICFAMIIATLSSQSATRLGSSMFAVLSWIAFGYCLLSGVRYTADCLSEEKREGTLGLLFLTDLRGYDVVLGKLIVTSLHAFYGLLAIFPLLGFPLMLGGVTGTEFWRTMLVMLNTLFFSLALGALVSSTGREERSVMLGTFFALLLINFGLPVVWKAVTLFPFGWDFAHIFLLPNPTYAFRLAAMPSFKTGVTDYWASMLTIFALAVAFLAIASWLLPWSFQEKGKLAQRGQAGGHWYRWRFGDPARRAVRRKLAAATNPFLWLVSRDRLPKFCAWAFVWITLGFGIFIYPVAASKRPPFVEIAILGSFGLHFLLKCLVASEACRRLNDDRRSGALELLLSTPLKIRHVVNGQCSALVRMFALPILALVGFNLMWIMAVNELEPGWVIFGGALTLVPDFLALSWVGMLEGVRAPRYSRSVIRTVGRVMAPSWMIILVFFFATMNGAVRNSTVHGFFFFWFSFGVIYDLVLAARDRHELRRNFRALAAQTPDKAERSFYLASNETKQVLASPPVLET